MSRGKCVEFFLGRHKLSVFQTCLIDRVFLTEWALAHAIATNEGLVGVTRGRVDYEHVTCHWVRVDDRLVWLTGLQIKSCVEEISREVFCSHHRRRLALFGCILIQTWVRSGF